MRLFFHLHSGSIFDKIFRLQYSNNDCLGEKRHYLITWFRSVQILYILQSIQNHGLNCSIKLTCKNSPSSSLNSENLFYKSTIYRPLSALYILSLFIYFFVFQISGFMCFTNQSARTNKHVFFFGHLLWLIVSEKSMDHQAPPSHTYIKYLRTSLYTKYVHFLILTFNPISLHIFIHACCNKMKAAIENCTLCARMLAFCIIWQKKNSLTGVYSFPFCNSIHLFNCIQLAFCGRPRYNPDQTSGTPNESSRLSILSYEYCTICSELRCFNTEKVHGIAPIWPLELLTRVHILMYSIHFDIAMVMRKRRQWSYPN